MSTPRPFKLKKAAPPVKKETAPCPHTILAFERGSFLLVCQNPACQKAWQAVNEERLIPDFFAQSVTPSVPFRIDPYSSLQQPLKPLFPPKDR